MKEHSHIKYTHDKRLVTDGKTCKNVNNNTWSYNLPLEAIMFMREWDMVTKKTICK